MAKQKRVPYAERRGLEQMWGITDTMCVFQVKADVESTARALIAATGNLKQWRKDIPRDELPECNVYAERFYPYRLRGHEWTVILHRYSFWSDTAMWLSRQLKTKVLVAGYEDCSGCLHWNLYENGVMVEIFSTDNGTDGFRMLSNTEFDRWFDNEDPRSFGKSDSGCSSYAVSKVRKLNAADFRALYEIPSKLNRRKTSELYSQRMDQLFDDFARSQDVLLSFNLAADDGEEYLPPSDALDEEIERVDVVGE